MKRILNAENAEKPTKHCIYTRFRLYTRMALLMARAHIARLAQVLGGIF